jgi:hypothetical protein
MSFHELSTENLRADSVQYTLQNPFLKESNEAARIEFVSSLFKSLRPPTRHSGELT